VKLLPRRRRSTKKKKIEFDEEDNSLYKAFQAGGLGCQPWSSAQDMPDELLNLKTKDGTYRGIVTGLGTQERQIEEVLMDPVDFTEGMNKLFPVANN